MWHLNPFQECSADLSVALSGVEPGHKALFDGGCQQQMSALRHGDHAAWWRKGSWFSVVCFAFQPTVVLRITW